MTYQIKPLFNTSIWLILLFLISLQGNVILAQNTGDQPDQNLPSYKFGGFLQQQFIADQSPDFPNRFSIHRARLGVSGSITERIKINLIGGYSEPPNNTPRLVNAFIDFNIHPLLQLRTGQFLLPFGLEGPKPIFLNSAIERTYAIRRMNTFTMFRDIGVQLSGKTSALSYSVALVNGAGANNTEQMNPKDVMGRVGLNLTKETQFGFSGHLGNYQPDPVSDNSYTRQRIGLDVNYSGQPLFIQGEYQWRWDDLPGNNQQTLKGGYILTGYRFMDDLEAITRFEVFDSGTSIENNQLTAFTIGSSYYFSGNTRLSLNYEFIDDQLDPNLGNRLTIQMQLTL